MKYVVIPNDIKDIDNYKNIDTFIVGLKDYSINYPSTDIDTIKELCKKHRLFVSINKNIFNSEIDDMLSVLKELSKLDIEGVLFYDLGILNLVIDNEIDINLVWHQTHMVTNYNTCNYYYSKGVKYGFVANEITLKEILEIKEKTDMKLMVEVFGYPIASHSRRLLLSNYLKSIDKEKEDRIYELSEKDITLRIKETKDGASILNGKITNGTKPLFDLINSNIDYLVLDMQDIDKELGLKVLDKYNYILNNIDKIDSKEKESIIDEMNDLIGNNTNFFYKETIYKVKRGE